MKIARATQKPGQTKEQTKLIAQGIQKGISQYKKQFKAKSRELDKRRTKTLQVPHSSTIDPAITTVYKQHWLPWTLLVISWAGFLGYLLYR